MKAIRVIENCQSNHISEEILISNEPLLLKNFVHDWPLVKEAKKSDSAVISYLRNFDAKKPLTAMTGDPSIKGRIFYNEDLSGFNFDYRRVSLEEIFQKLTECSKLQEPPMIYVGSTNIDNWLPGFREENDITLGKHQPIASLWIGNRSRVAPHYDFPTNIACSVAGKRRFTFFSPEHLDNLYVGPIDFSPAGQPISLVDLLDPDYEKFPKYRNAESDAIVADLDVGDAVLIPSMWWHHVEARNDLNVLVNYWWRTTPNFMGSPLNVLQHAIMGLRDLPDEQRGIWKSLFDYYVFNQKEENISHIPENARGALNPMDENIADKIKNVLSDKFR
tara:strand:- start:2436 stop:3434 length:999 start_codon:yes stop_codon:yes gene_type:complete